ncbi:MAG: DUF58 domain-containing protein [Gammaproteobacteria bacterium]
MLAPAPRLLLLAWLVVALGIAAAIRPALLPLAGGVAALLALAALLDGLIAWRTPAPTLRREIPHAFPLGHWRGYVLELATTTARALPCEIFDLHPDDADSEGLPARVVLRPGEAARVPARLRFHRRGDHRLDGAHLRWTGPLQLVHCRRTVGSRDTVRVYPDFAAVARYALLATDNRLSQLGIRRRQRRGEGLDFRQLREYRAGDALRQIDWKATSRLRKLISREYQEERDQQVVFLLDCGFRMRSQDGELSHFDSALNALLLLSYVVLRQGDAAGCYTFAGHGEVGGDDNRWLAPAKGRERMSALMNGLFDLEPTHRTPDFRQLAVDCGKRLHKRSLIVLMTNVRDEDTEDLLACARLLGQRHLVLVATLREKVLDKMGSEAAATMTAREADEAAIASAAARLFLAERERALQRLRAEGLLVLDTTPEELPVRLVNAYLEIKRSGRL